MQDFFANQRAHQREHRVQRRIAKKEKQKLGL